MIYIEQNALNKIFVDVSYATGSTPNFLWNLKNSQGMNVKNFIPRDITATYPSQYAGKYKVFEFSTIPTLPENLTPTGTSVVNIVLPNLNQFWLGIYEQSGIVNLNPNNAVKVLNSLAFSFWDKTSEYYTGNTSNTADNVIYYESGGIIPSPTPTGTPQPSSSPTPTQTGTPTPTPTATETPTPTPTPSSTPSPLNPEWNLGGGFDNAVYGIFESGSTPNKSYYICGTFNSYDGALVGGIVKTDQNGNRDTNFSGRKPISTLGIFSLYFDVDDTIVAVGSFNTYDGILGCDRMVRIDKDTGAPIGFTGNTFNGSVSGILGTSDNKKIAWGAFTTYTGSPYQRIIRFNSDWSVDNTYWNASNNANQIVHKVIENLNGNYVIVGGFTQYQGLTQNRIVEVNSTTGAKTSLFGTGSNGTLHNIRQDSLGNYYIITNSETSTFNGVSAPGLIIKVDSSGNMDTLWGVAQGGYAGIPTTMFLDEVNGWIYTIGLNDGSRRYYLSTGALDTSWTSQQQVIFGSSSITSLGISVDYDTNKVLIGNNFTIYQGTPYSRFVRLNPDGTSNTTTT